MEENQLKMNDSKMDFTVIGTLHNLRKNILDNINIGKTKIYQLIEFLGVYLDELLNLKDHIPAHL